MTTIIKIDKSEKDTIAKLLVEHCLTHSFYTIENNDLMLQCAIETDSPVVMYHLGRTIGSTIMHDIWTRDITAFRAKLAGNG